MESETHQDAYPGRLEWMAVILLLSVIFSTFGLTPLSRIAISIGILVFMTAIMSLEMRLMDLVSNIGYL